MVAVLDCPWNSCFSCVCNRSSCSFRWIQFRQVLVHQLREVAITRTDLKKKKTWTWSAKSCGQVYAEILCFSKAPQSINTCSCVISVTGLIDRSMCLHITLARCMHNRYQMERSYPRWLLCCFYYCCHPQTHLMFSIRC